MPTIGPSAKGKKASEAIAQPASRSSASSPWASRHFDRDPARIDPAHLTGSDPEGHPVLREDDRIRLDVATDGPGEEHVDPGLLGRLRLGDHFHHLPLFDLPSRSWIRMPPRTRLMSFSRESGKGGASSVKMRMFSFCWRISIASGS